MLDVTLNECPQQCSVVLSGSINAMTIDAFRDTVGELVLSSSRKVLIDCGELLSINSIGLGLFVELARHFQNNVVLFNVKRPVRLLLDMSGLNRIVTVEGSVTLS